MGTNGFQKVVTSEERLREILGQPGKRALLKDQARLDAHFRAFIAGSPFLLLATANSAGQCDVSPKGDGPGFVQVLDDTHLAIPDRIGNNRLDGMRNILHNPHVGIIFLIPGREDTLRVNGRAWITRDARLLDLCVVQGKVPLLAIGVEVEACFLHCAKAFRRSRLWSPEGWPPPDALPSMACVLFDQIKPEGVTVHEYERDIDEASRKLY